MDPANTLFGLGAHSDDLAFSLGGALWDGRLAGCRPVTVFSLSGYTLETPRGNVVQTTALRKTEDQRFFSATAAGAPVWLDLADAPLRRDLAGQTVFSAAVLPEEVTAVMHGLAGLLPVSAALLAPMAMGGHLDHRVLRSAACELYRQGLNVIFYEDLPYAGFTPPTEVKKLAIEIGRDLGARLCPRYWPSPYVTRAKQLAVESYRSQTDASFILPLLRHAQSLALFQTAAERVWVPCGSLSFFAAMTDAERRRDSAPLTAR